MTLHSTLAIGLEWSAVVLNIGFTVLIAYERRTGWILGFVAALVGVLLYGVQDAWLMAALNGFYAAMGAYGWWSWGRAAIDRGIVRYKWPKHLLMLGLGVVGTIALRAAMRWLQVPGEHQGMEAFIASFAMVATWMMSDKALENWLYWTIGDTVAVVYNHWLGYDGYALLNLVYIVLAVVGFVRWRKLLMGQEASSL